MSKTLRPNRRHAIAALGALGVVAATASHASAIDASDFGLVPDSDEDQTERLAKACTAARDANQTLIIPAGQFRIRNLELFGNIVIEGVPGRSFLHAYENEPVAIAQNFSDVVLRHLSFRGEAGAVPDGPSGLLLIRNTTGMTSVERCKFSGSAIGIAVENASATITECEFGYLDDAAIHSMDSLGLLISGNRIDTCGNAGIRIWRSESGPDGSIITNNRISKVDWRGGGNGQNGNGINVFKADDVIIADNHIADCAFTAVRLNTTNNAQVSGNICLNSGEVAIFSEFEFSGSVIANNIIDGAATGISITNLDVGGHLAVCSGNIVRNITPVSTVNPDTIPIGIFAEADTAITGNTVSNVPGVGIAAGYGTFLRNVLISGNVVTESRFGIGVSVVEAAGSVTIGSNMVEAREHAIVGMAWQEVVETDLVVNAARYTNVRIDP